MNSLIPLSCVEKQIKEDANAHASLLQLYPNDLAKVLTQDPT
jgi:hypothetical protein